MPQYSDFCHLGKHLSKHNILTRIMAFSAIKLRFRGTSTQNLYAISDI